jgi:hypothetical protein
MGLKSMFKTDASLEKKGIILDYGKTRIRIARAGGANKRFAKTLERLSKPYRRAIQTETLDTDLGNEVLHQVYAEAVILGWEENTGVSDEGEKTWTSGINPEDAGVESEDLLPVNRENILKVFKNLPDLFTDIQQQSQKVALFRQDVMETDAGN